MRNRRLLIILLVLVIGLPVAAFTTIYVAPIATYYIASHGAARDYKRAAATSVVKPPPHLDTFRFPDDFRDQTTDGAFIRMRLSLGYAPGDTATAQQITEKMPRLRDIVNLILASKSRKDVETVESQLELREEIRASMNHVLKGGKIHTVYFDEFLVN